MISVVKPGERFANRNPGGGGYGNPAERPVESVLNDVRNGIVSVRGAREDYGVVIDTATGQVDREATAQLRGRLTAAA
jgi:N-methylhydantoinase B